MKKILALSLALLALCGALSALAELEIEEAPGEAELVLSNSAIDFVIDDSGVLTGYNGVDADIVIPSESAGTVPDDSPSRSPHAKI